jgi:hypothetical protein
MDIKLCWKYLLNVLTLYLYCELSTMSVVPFSEMMRVSRWFQHANALEML